MPPLPESSSLASLPRDGATRRSTSPHRGSSSYVVAREFRQFNLQVLQVDNLPRSENRTSRPPQVPKFHPEDDTGSAGPPQPSTRRSCTSRDNLLSEDSPESSVSSPRCAARLHGSRGQGCATLALIPRRLRRGGLGTDPGRTPRSRARAAPAATSRQRGAPRHAPGPASPRLASCRWAIS